MLHLDVDVFDDVVEGSFDVDVQGITRTGIVCELREDGASDSGVQFLDWGTEVLSGYLEAFCEIGNSRLRVGTHQFLHSLFDLATMTVFGHDIEREAIASA